MKPFCTAAKRSGNREPVRSDQSNRGVKPMLLSVLNLIYREFLKQALMGMTMQGGKP